MFKSEQGPFPVAGSQGACHGDVMARETDMTIRQRLVWRPADAARAIFLAGVGSVTWRVLDATAPGDDFFDSDLYWWTWIALPLVGAVAGALRSGPWRPLVWAASLMGPSMLANLYIGTIGHDPDDGASLWMVGEIFLIVTGTMVAGARKLGEVMRREPVRPRGD